MNSHALRVFAAITLVLTLAAVLQTSAFADGFDDHTAFWLRRGIADSKPVESMTMRQGLSLKRIGRGIDAPCVVIKTDEDNWAKALVGWGFRKSGDGGRIPVVLIERFVTYRGDRQNLTTSSGKDVMLFPGFGFNFDIGQVVPEGQGEDILCGPEGVLSPADGAELFGLHGPATPEPEPRDRPDPKSHPGVFPTDFAGSWHVRIDGRWEGRWELDVDGRQVFGRFISDETQSVYEISGRIAARPHNAKLDIALVNAEQTVDAYLWTKDKSAMAGTITMAERKLGFYATRVEVNAEAEPEAPESDSPEE